MKAASRTPRVPASRAKSVKPSGVRKATVAAEPVRRGYGGRSAAELQADRRARLLAAAKDLFATRGYAHTPIELLCAEAKVTTRHFYEQFQSREALLSAVYEDIIRELKAAVLGALQVPGLSPEQKISGAIHALVHSYLDDPRHARIGVLEAVGVSADMERRRRDVIHDFARVLERYCYELADAGAIPQRDYHLISVALVGGINELLADWLTAERPPATQQLIDVISELLRALILGGQMLRAQESTPP